VYIGELMN